MRGATLSQCSSRALRGVAVDAEVVELLRGEVEDCALVVLLGGREVQGPARADVER